MKALTCLLAISTLAVASCGKTPSSSSNAELASAAGREAAPKYVCIEYNRQTGKLLQKQVVLTPAAGATIGDGASAKYTIEIFEGSDESPAKTAAGRVENEDVSFGFVSADGAIKFHIYLDEMRESSLSVGGVDKGMFICR